MKYHINKYKLKVKVTLQRGNCIVKANFLQLQHSEHLSVELAQCLVFGPSTVSAVCAVSGVCMIIVEWLCFCFVKPMIILIIINHEDTFLHINAGQN